LHYGVAPPTTNLFSVLKSILYRAVLVLWATPNKKRGASLWVVFSGSGGCVGGLWLWLIASFLFWAVSFRFAVV